MAGGVLARGYWCREEVERGSNNLVDIINNESVHREKAPSIKTRMRTCRLPCIPASSALYDAVWRNGK